ncbi:hypothetical protein JWZ98_03230 [Methylomonas sp. EFPC1]|nr:hypothetical protein [Methylomonas sp. EFPC1]QSB01988.1 hypothetical protein JWZ98_03230 [Methylomonas sp. EFPC1]
MAKVTAFCLALLLAACTPVTVIQITPRKDLKHPVPPPKGWIWEAKA